MNTKTNLAAVFIATILCLLAVLLLNSCSSSVEGNVMGKGRSEENFYLMLCSTEECVQSVPVEVSEQEYESYQTGDFYDADN